MRVGRVRRDPRKGIAAHAIQRGLGRCDGIAADIVEPAIAGRHGDHQRDRIGAAHLQSAACTWLDPPALYRSGQAGGELQAAVNACSIAIATGHQQGRRSVGLNRDDLVRGRQADIYV